MELAADTLSKYMRKEAPSSCVSIYIPTHSSSNSQTMNEDRIAYKNALQKVNALTEGDDALKSTLVSLQDLMDDNDFWLHQGQSLAIFADKDGFETVKLPYELTSVVEYGDKYAISPLAIMENLNRSYFVLDIDFKQPKLYAGNTFSLSEVTDADLPGSIEEILDIEIERQNTVGSRGGAQGSSSIYYGHNEVVESRAHDATRYLRILADSINKYLADKSGPLLLAGSPKVIAEFKTMIQHSDVLEKDLAVNYDASRLVELFNLALAEIEALVEAERKEAVNRYQQTDFEQKVDGITAVSVAAEQGKVDTLLLPVLRITTDSIRDLSEPRPLVELPEDFEAFEAAVRKVAEQAGKIIVVESSDFAEDPSMKAILRF